MGSGKISYAGVGMASGGLLGLLGVFAKWFGYSYPVDGGAVTTTLAGTADWTGSVAYVAGLGALAFGGAYLVLSDPGVRRILVALAGVCAILLLASSMLGYFRVEEAVGVPVREGEFATSIRLGLLISFLGGVVAVVGAFLSVREQLAAAPEPVVEQPAEQEQPQSV
jgi:hypothetical protein